MPNTHHIQFERAYGTHTYALDNERAITAVSQPTWQQFKKALSELQPEEAGTFVLSPELITSAGLTIDAIHRASCTIGHRIKDAAEISRKWPQSTLLLGTAIFEDHSPKPHNAVTYIQNGKQIDQTRKLPAINLLEGQIFQQTSEPRRAAMRRGLQTIICSDVLRYTDFSQDLDPGAEVLAISACWSTPVGRKGIAPSPASRLEEALQYAAGTLFERNPSLSHIIMADRLPPESTSVQPFNFYARRVEAAGPRMF